MPAMPAPARRSVRRLGAMRPDGATDIGFLQGSSFVAVWQPSRGSRPIWTVSLQHSGRLASADVGHLPAMPLLYRRNVTLDAQRQRRFGAHVSVWAYGASDFWESRRTSHGRMIFRKITGSGHVPGVRPMCPPAGLIQASRGSVPLLIKSSRSSIGTWLSFVPPTTRIGAVGLPSRPCACSDIFGRNAINSSADFMPYTNRLAGSRSNRYSRVYIRLRKKSGWKVRWIGGDCVTTPARRLASVCASLAA